jgi:cell division transport system ATP-binding protein
MIHLHDVSKSYNARQAALHGITFSIGQGEFALVTGPSGAGKTTLLKLLYGAERADSGRIFVNGRTVGNLKPRQLPALRRSIGVVFQDFKLVPHSSVYHNVALPLRVVGTAEREVKRRVWGVLKEVGLTTKIETLPPMLSGGEQQRVALARALVAEPAIVLADEPTGNLDPTLTMAIMDLLRAANQRGTTVVVATHDNSIVERIPGRTLTLDRGRLTSGEA